MQGTFLSRLVNFIFCAYVVLILLTSSQALSHETPAPTNQVVPATQQLTIEVGELQMHD